MEIKGFFTNLLSWVKAKKHFESVPGVSIKVGGRYNPTPKDKLIDFSTGLFVKILNQKASMKDKIQAREELNFVKRVNENIEDFLLDVENKEDMRLKIDVALNIGQKALGEN